VFRKCLLIAVLVGGLVSMVMGQRQNLMPDAVTRATTWNNSEGAVEAVWDGLHPGNSASAPSFVWTSKGILVTEFAEPVRVSECRAYTGDACGSLSLRGYLGGRLNDEGQGRDPQGQLLLVRDDYSHLTNGWLSIPLDEDLLMDNVELECLGRTEYYEIELLGPEGTNVEGTSWGEVKSEHQGRELEAVPWLDQIDWQARRGE